MTSNNFDGNKLKLWVEYEKIAIHFNGLLIQLRLRALAGIGAITTLASFVANKSGEINWDVILFVSLGLMFAWVAIFILDYFYYHRLLQGAVVAIISLERSTKDMIPSIEISTKIENEIGRPETPAPRVWAVLIFYGIVLVMLLGMCFYSLHNLGFHLPCNCLH